METGVIVAEESMVLLGHGAVYWPQKNSLIVADLHWGKEDTFRAGGVPIPAGPLVADLSRLEALIRHTASERLLILGDLWHDRVGIVESLLTTVQSWRDSLRELAIELVLGNHDRHVGSLQDALRMQVHGHEYIEPPFIFSHFPNPSPSGYVLAGHIHPAIMLRGAGRQKLRLPCFWLREQVGVLPAFGRFTGGFEIAPEIGDRVFAIADEQVIEVKQSIRVPVRSPISKGGK